MEKSWGINKYPEVLNGKNDGLSWKLHGCGESNDYDIVIGAMVNDQIYNYIADYIDGIITREQFWSLARFKYPTHQINFCSPAALRCLEFISCEEAKKE